MTGFLQNYLLKTVFYFFKIKLIYKVYYFNRVHLYLLPIQKLMANNPECPVDFITVNENKVRLTALHVLLLSVVYVWLMHWSIAAFLTIDFFCRAFNWGKYSLLNLISEKEVQVFSVKSKPIDQAPKRFAAKIGFIFSLSILASMLFNYTNTAIVLSVILSMFAFLESFAGFCAGCYVYTFFIKIFPKKQPDFQA